MNSQDAKKYLPEYKKILEMAGGRKPRKFVEKIKLIETPAMFNPSDIGDCAYMSSYMVDKSGNVSPITGYSYGSMMCSGVEPTERIIDVPDGTRVWVVTYDGMWGGSWKVDVFVHKSEYKLLSGMAIKE